MHPGGSAASTQLGISHTRAAKPLPRVRGGRRLPHIGAGLLRPVRPRRLRPLRESEPPPTTSQARIHDAGVAVSTPAHLGFLGRMPSEPYLWM